MEENQNRRKVRSYVLRGGRLSPAQQRAIERLQETYCIPYEPRLRDPNTHFPQAREVVVEIGFGMGDATVEIAKSSQQTNFIGIEVHPPGVGKLLSEIEEHGLENIRIIQHDAVEALEMFPDGSISGFHIFFPDPWPKKKHHKRRLIQPQFVTLLSRKLKPGGYIYAVTDWEEYAHHILEVLSEDGTLVNGHEGFAPPVPWRPRTKFEQKGLAKAHIINELWFIRREG